jgi:hypothetical protein
VTEEPGTACVVYWVRDGDRGSWCSHFPAIDRRWPGCATYRHKHPSSLWFSRVSRRLTYILISCLLQYYEKLPTLPTTYNKFLNERVSPRPLLHRDAEDPYLTGTSP